MHEFGNLSIYGFVSWTAVRYFLLLLKKEKLFIKEEKKRNFFSLSVALFNISQSKFVADAAYLVFQCEILDTSKHVLHVRAVSAVVTVCSHPTLPPQLSRTEFVPFSFYSEIRPAIC